jgi:uncharacterized protein RhaS with RHS repeats
MNRSMKDKPVSLLALVAALVIPALLPQSAHGMYDPKHGRWLQRDPAGYVDGMNLYQYTGSSPVVLVDPTGGCSKPAPPPCTCCCALGLRGPLPAKPETKSNRTYSKGSQWHEFKVEADVTYVPVPLGTLPNTDCTVEWWEWMDNYPSPNNTKESWANQLTNGNAGSKTFEDLRRHLKDRLESPCPYLAPKKNTIVFTDDPGIYKRSLWGQSAFS